MKLNELIKEYGFGTVLGGIIVMYAILVCMFILLGGE